MEFVKIKIHPLFLLMMLACAIFGGLPNILLCLTTALLHECGHIFYAARLGFSCSEVKIMPYGAAAVCNVEGIRAKEELGLALAGPCVNGAICLLLAGTWWFFPESYAYTDLVMNANLGMLAINLLPAYPLDGGRALKCLLTKRFSQRASLIFLKCVAALCAIALCVGFIFSGFNFSLATLALFLIFSIFEKPVNATLINFSSGEAVKRGVEVKYMLCNGELTFLQAFKMLEEKKYLVLQLLDENGVADEITQDELYSLAVCHGVYDKVFEDCLQKGSENLSFSTLPSTKQVASSTPSSIASSTTAESDEKS